MQYKLMIPLNISTLQKRRKAKLNLILLTTMFFGVTITSSIRKYENQKIIRIYRCIIFVDLIKNEIIADIKYNILWLKYKMIRFIKLKQCCIKEFMCWISHEQKMI
jgi:hypothetical protein|uniref:Transmembrane protein n=1 Tax=Sipha flava TaxID=143950 RepID=A0A2S2R6V6_9HEMI